MQNLKTQIEIRYSPILGFNELYKEIFTPYLKLGLVAINEGRFANSVVLIMKDHSYQLDCRWDNFIFTSEGAIDLRSPNGPMSIYAEIFSKIKSSPRFGEVKNVLLAEWNLITGEKINNYDSALAAFKERYFKSDVILDVDGFESPDLAIVTEHNSTSKNLRHTFGPYDSKKDPTNLNLNPISGVPGKGISELNGLLIQSSYLENRTTFDPSTYRSFSKIINDSSQRIHL